MWPLVLSGVGSLLGNVFHIGGSGGDPGTVAQPTSMGVGGLGGFLPWIGMEALGSLFNPSVPQDNSPIPQLATRWDGRPPVFPTAQWMDNHPGVPEWNYYPGGKRAGVKGSTGAGGDTSTASNGKKGGDHITPLYSNGRTISGPGVPKHYAQGGLASIAPSDGPQVSASTKSEDTLLIQEAIKALNGQSPHAQEVVHEFIKRFGFTALSHLREQVSKQVPPDPTQNQPTGGVPEAYLGVRGDIQGPGDGMSDSVPATIDGHKPAELSSGEFVMPADVVSGIGSGSTDAGVRRLHETINQVRKHRTGSTEQPDALPWHKIKPEKAVA